MKIFKYTIPIQGQFILALPEHARILSVQVQRGVPCIWVLVHPKAVLTERKFNIYGTGHDVENPGNYIGTFQMASGDLIWHLFEE